MFLSHRLLREAHKKRNARRERALDRHAYDAPAELAALSDYVRGCEEIGIIDPALLDTFETTIASALMAFIDGLYGELAASEHLATSVLDGRIYKPSLGKQLAVASSAIAHIAVEERIWSALNEVLRWHALKDHTAPAAVPKRGCPGRVAEPVTTLVTEEAAGAAAQR